jgi:hypothetical protein
MTREEFKSLVGEGIHTGLRKGCQSRESSAAWKAIDDLPDWDDALSFLADGFEAMGYTFRSADPAQQEREAYIQELDGGVE